jgi:hypothetical protein
MQPRPTNDRQRSDECRVKHSIECMGPPALDTAEALQCRSLCTIKKSVFEKAGMSFIK